MLETYMGKRGYSDIDSQKFERCIREHYEIGDDEITIIYALLRDDAPPCQYAFTVRSDVDLFNSEPELRTDIHVVNLERISFADGSDVFSGLFAYHEETKTLVLFLPRR